MSDKRSFDPDSRVLRMRDDRTPRIKPRIAAIAKKRHCDPVDVIREGLHDWCDRQETDLGILASEGEQTKPEGVEE